MGRERSMSRMGREVKECGVDRLGVEGGQGRDGCEGQWRGWDGRRGWKRRDQ